MDGSRVEIEKLLFAEIDAALRRIAAASGTVQVNIADMPAGMVATDSPEQVDATWNERAAAVIMLSEALERLHAFTLLGDVPIITANKCLCYPALNCHKIADHDWTSADRGPDH